MYQTLQLIPADYTQWHAVQSVFSHFSEEPWALLFDSSQAKHIDSRYDLILRRPAEVLYVQGEALFYEQNSNQAQSNPKRIQLHKKQLFQQLRQWLSRVPKTKNKTDIKELPFTGGLAGFAGYSFFNSKSEQPASEPRLPDAAFGLYSHALIVDHQNQSCYFVAPAHFSEQDNLDFWTLPAHEKQPFKRHARWQSNMTQADYIHKVQTFFKACEQKKCTQINLAQRFEAQCEGHSWLAYQQLSASNRTPFSCYFKLPQAEILCLSPERFIRVSNTGHVQAKPIKGTRPRLNDIEQDQQSIQALLQSNKERTENLLIAQQLCQELQPFCRANSVTISQPLHIESFPAVHHLVSTVTGTLKQNQDALALYEQLLPGSSIAGHPKKAAMRLIDTLEPHARTVYCGSFLFASFNGYSDSNIAIRTLVRQQDQIYCWAGSGLLEASNPEEEYQETFDKLSHILAVI